MPNPTIECALAGIEAFKAAQADYLVAIGGGSLQDTCKAIGIVITNPEFADIRSLEGVADTKNASVPIIALGTTAGTAAEVTINYVITDLESRRKFFCVDPHDIPQVAIIDSELMASMPKALKAATGMDALTHAIEGYITQAAWELTDALHLKAIKIIARTLRASVAGDPEGVEGMAHPLGAFYDTPHGVANAILLPSIMTYNAEYTGGKYRDIARAMSVRNTEPLTIEDARKAAVDAVQQLSSDVGVPTNLTEVGVLENDVDALAESVMDDVCTSGNPRPTKFEDVKALYRALL